jgi:hypothetical protein
LCRFIPFLQAMAFGPLVAVRRLMGLESERSFHGPNRQPSRSLVQQKFSLRLKIAYE